MYDQSLRQETLNIARSRDSPAWDDAATVGAMKQKQFLIVTTSGAGGDLQPLVAAALAVRDRGHQITFVGDRSVGRALRDLDVDVQVLPSEYDLGPRLAGAIRDAMAETGGD